MARSRFLLSLLLVLVIAGCEDSEATTRTSVPSGDDDHNLYIEEITDPKDDKQYKCIIYSHASAEEGGVWCENKQPTTTTTYYR